MLDFNFFEIHSEKHEKQSLKRLVVISLVTIVITAAILYPVFNYITINKLNKEIVTMKSVLYSDNTYEVINKLEDQKAELERLNTILKELTVANEMVDSQRTIDEGVIRYITGNLPKNVYIQAISIRPELIDIKASTTSKEDIAQFEFNLKNSFGDTKVFIPSIVLNDDLYKFSLIITIEDVKADENK